jgi:proline iminopeptidase
MKFLSHAFVLGFIVLVVVVGLCKGDEDGYKIINGARLYYRVTGEGVPIVLVHGGPGLDHGYFLPQMARLGKGYKLIFYDQRATGRSSTDVDTNSMTMDNFVEDLEGIRKAFNLEKMNLMGHSWGGLIAMFYAVKYPTHLGSLMLINSTPASAVLRDSTFSSMSARMSKGDSIEQAEITASTAFKQREPETMAKFFRLLFRGTFYQKRYIDSLSLNFDSTYAKISMMQRFLSRDSVLKSYDLFEKLDTIQCPVMIVGGDHDMIPPAFNERIQEHIKNSRYICLPDCGHFPFVEAQDEFFPTVRAFLSGIPQTNH